MTVSPLKSCLCMFTSHWACRFCASPLFLKTLGPSFSNKISKKRKFDFPLTSWCLSTSMEQFMQSSVLKKKYTVFLHSIFCKQAYRTTKIFCIYKRTLNNVQKQTSLSAKNTFTSKIDCDAKNYKQLN